VTEGKREKFFKFWPEDEYEQELINEYLKPRGLYVEVEACPLPFK
jgi:hypothetical protein